MTLQIITQDDHATWTLRADGQLWCRHACGHEWAATWGTTPLRSWVIHCLNCSRPYAPAPRQMGTYEVRSLRLAVSHGNITPDVAKLVFMSDHELSTRPALAGARSEVVLRSTPMEVPEYIRRDLDRGRKTARFRLLDDEQKPDADGAYRLIASSDEPCRFDTEDGPIYEVLSHRAEDVEISTCRSLLLNHDPDKVIGAVQSIAFQLGRSLATVNVHPDAVLVSGITVRDAIDTGALRGVSIGYVYDISNSTWDPDKRTVTVNNWRWSEVTLTPIPRDSAAHVARTRPTGVELSSLAVMDSEASNTDVPPRDLDAVDIVRQWDAEAHEASMDRNLKRILVGDSDVR